MILNDVSNLIEEAMGSVIGSYNKMLGDINDLEQNKANIMKMPMMNPQDKIAILQNQINNTEQLKQMAMMKQQEIANYSNQIVDKYSQQFQQKDNAKSK